MNDNEPMKYNHWIYGKCNNDSDIKGISNLVNQELYEQALCIRKYYNKEKDEYYDTDNVNFRWPSVDKGCSHPNRTFYGIIVEKCRNITARKKAGFEDCNSEEEIDKYIFNSSIIIQLIDYYPDVLNYKSPFEKYFYALTNGLYRDSITVNHLNFNPALMTTHNGIFFDNIIEEHSFIFIQNEKVTFEDKVITKNYGIDSPKKTGIVVCWYFWMLNSMEYFERNYKRLQDILGDIGGLSSIVLFFVEILNFILSNYTILLDSNEMINIISDENIKLNQKINIFNKNNEAFQQNYNNNSQNNKLKSSNHQRFISENDEYLYNKNFIINNNKEDYKSDKSKKYILFKKNNINKILNIYTRDDLKLNNIKKRNKKNSVKINIEKNIENYTSGNELRRNNEINNINLMNNSNKVSKEKENHYLKKINFSFFKYLEFLICCGKKNKKFSFYEDLRTKIISEENLTRIYFQVYNLLKNKIDYRDIYKILKKIN